LRNDLAVELDERDYARKPLDEAELKDIFSGLDPRDYLNPKSPAYKAMGLNDKKLTAAEAIKLMARDPNLIQASDRSRRKAINCRFRDRDRLREVLG